MSTPWSYVCGDCGTTVFHKANPNTIQPFLVMWKPGSRCPSTPDGHHDICVRNENPNPEELLTSSKAPVSGTHNSYPGTSLGGCFPECIIYVDFFDPIEATVSQLIACGSKTKRIILVGLDSASISRAKKKKNFRKIVSVAERRGINFDTFEWSNKSSYQPLRFP